jgi:hypothetical protein
MTDFRIARYHSIAILMHYEEPIAHAPRHEIPWKGDAEQLAHCRAWRFFSGSEVRPGCQPIIRKLLKSHQDRIQRVCDRASSEEYSKTYYPSQDLQDKRELREDIIYLKKKERERLMRLNAEPPIHPPLANTVSEWD